MKIAIMHADVSSRSGKDEQDVLVQAEAVRRSLLELGHEVLLITVTLDLEKADAELVQTKPDLVFNLVESLAGTSRFLHFAPALLERRSIPFTGAGSDCLYATTNKLLTKERLRHAGLATPDWMRINGRRISNVSIEPPYIVKPAAEDASVGLDDASVAYSRENLAQVFHEKTDLYGECFVESYIDGREFNVSLLADRDDEVQVLPPAEILFEDFPADKPRIVGYDAKWETGSFEYRNTARCFDVSEADAALLQRLDAVSRRCWDIFNLRGYARVDFRIDRDSNPWVIEVNANPCISPDAGFTAAAERAGIGYTGMIGHILEDAFL
jgi:D-alanine-D-alanine ligase